MGFLDNLKDKAEDFGDKAKEGLGAARDKASGLVEDVKDRLDGDDETPAADTAEPGIDYSPAAVDEAAGGIGEAAADAGGGTVDPTESPVDSVGDVPEPDLGDVAAPGLGEVPDAVLGDLPEAPGDESTPIEGGTGQLGNDLGNHPGNDKDEFGPA